MWNTSKPWSWRRQVDLELAHALLGELHVERGVGVAVLGAEHGLRLHVIAVVRALGLHVVEAQQVVQRVVLISVGGRAAAGDEAGDQQPGEPHCQPAWHPAAHITSGSGTW